MEIEISQSIFLLKIARVAQAGLADVDCRHPRIGLAQRMNGSLRCSAAGDQDLSICPRLLRRPQQKGRCPAPIRVAIELAVPIEVVDRRRIRVAFVESAHRVGSPSPRLRAEGRPPDGRPCGPFRGEGRFFEFGQEPLENPVQILNDIVAPDADHAITEGRKLAVALPVFGAFRVLAAVELDNQAPLATNKVSVVPIDRLLANEFEAGVLSTAIARPQCKFGWRESARNDRARSARFWSLPRNAAILRLRELALHPGPLPASGVRAGRGSACGGRRIRPPAIRFGWVTSVCSPAASGARRRG